MNVSLALEIHALVLNRVAFKWFHCASEPMWAAPRLREAGGREPRAKGRLVRREAFHG